VNGGVDHVDVGDAGILELWPGRFSGRSMGRGWPGGRKGNAGARAGCEYALNGEAIDERAMRGSSSRRTDGAIDEIVGLERETLLSLLLWGSR
jgi:hypothetical protein